MLRVNTPDSQPYPLVDTYQWTLTRCPRARGPHPRGTRATLFPGHFRCQYGKQKSLLLLWVVILKFNWLTSRASHLQASDFGPISASNRRQALRLFGGVGQNRSRPMGSKNPIGGVHPSFSSLPPLTSPIFLAPYQNPEKMKALHLAVREMEMKGAI